MLKKVMNVIGLQLISNEAKKLTKAAIAISKKMLKTCLKIQYNVAVFPIYFLYGGLKYVYQQSYTSNNENEASLEPQSDVIVEAVKKLRNIVVSGMNGISSSRRDNQIDSMTIDNDAPTDDEQNSCLYKDELYEPIPDVLEEGCSTTEISDKFSQIAFLKANEFTGCDLMWDVPIISAKAKYFAQCLKERKMDKIAAARKVLEDHSINSPMPKTRREYDKLMDEARNGLKYFSKSSIIKSKNSIDSRNACKCNFSENKKNASNVLEEKPIKVEFCFDDNEPLRHFSKDKASKCLSDPLWTRDNNVRREIVLMNRKLRKINATCTSLLNELSNLNEDLAKVISMKEKLTNLEFQVDEGKKLLQEVESDRFVMKSKLSALEKLIREEEEFLYDIACESGFYESENNAGTVGEI